MKNNLINFKNGSLDCYSKSIDNFIIFLINNILDQIRKCKSKNSYKKYTGFLNDFEKIINNKNKLKVENFIKIYFNKNNNINILKKRRIIISNSINPKALSGKFSEHISGKEFINFYLEDFLFKKDFESILNKTSNNSNDIFSEVIIDNKTNNKIYLEYKIKKEHYYICFCILDENEILDEKIIFKDLLKYTNFVIKNINDSNLIDFNMENYFFLKLKRNNNENKINTEKEIKEISDEIIKYLNDEVIKDIILNRYFIEYLHTFLIN